MTMTRIKELEDLLELALRELQEHNREPRHTTDLSVITKIMKALSVNVNN